MSNSLLTSQIGQADGFGLNDAAPSVEQKNVGREGEFDKPNLPKQFFAAEQFGRADSFDINEAALSAEQQNVGGERAKTAVALRMVNLLINVDEIFSGGRAAGRS